MSAADNPTKKSRASARERARQATTGRLAAEHARLRKNENDLVTFFDAGKTTERVSADVEKRTHAIPDDAAIKIAAAELEQATALRTIKDRGETVASIAEATDLSAAEVRKRLKRAPRRRTRDGLNTEQGTDHREGRPRGRFTGGTDS